MSRATDLSGRTARGMAWSLTATVGGRLISLASLAVLARLLAPEDFGLLAFALVYLGYLETVGDLGTGMALVYWKDRWRDVAQLTFVANVVMGLFWMALTWVTAPFVAEFLGSPEGEPILRALAWILPLKGLATTHDALLQRRLRFRTRLVPELALMGGKAVVAVALAALGFGVWSLVWGQLVGQALWSVLLWALVDWRPEARFPRDLLGPVFRYGRGIVSVNVIAAVVHHVDILVVGRMFGAVVLGFYQIASRLPDVAVTLVVRVTSKVLFPAFSRAEGGERLRPMYLSALRYLSLLVVPTAVGIVLLAEPLVLTAFGDQWLPSVPLVQALAAYAGIRALGSYAGDLLKATGRPGTLALLGGARAIVLVPALVVAGARSPLAVALALGAVTTVSTVVNVVVAARILEAPARALLKAMSPSVAASIPMAGVLVAWSRLAGTLPAWAELTAGTLVGGVVYLGAVRLIAPEAVERAVEMARSSRIFGRDPTTEPVLAASEAT